MAWEATLSFFLSQDVVVVDLNMSEATGQGIDVVNGIEALEGSQCSDEMWANDATANTLFGDVGNNRLKVGTNASTTVFGGEEYWWVMVDNDTMNGIGDDIRLFVWR
mmetsp:Transcript_14654/g.21879  ORF Transcript_14654/g.21879 Transcript_14654/m.21879 type:complete len:107 (+) Transcript_14654:35-355(+)